MSVLSPPERGRNSVAATRNASAGLVCMRDTRERERCLCVVGGKGGRCSTGSRTITFDHSIPLHLERHRKELIFNSEGLKEESHAPEFLILSEKRLRLKELVRLRSQNAGAYTYMKREINRIQRELGAPQAGDQRRLQLRD